MATTKTMRLLAVAAVLFTGSGRAAAQVFWMGDGLDYREQQRQTEMMTRMVEGCHVTTTGQTVCGGAHGPTGPILDETEVLSIAGRLAGALDCKPASRDPGRAFCAATGTNPLPLFWPRGDVAFWGASMLLVDGEDPRRALSRPPAPRILDFFEARPRPLQPAPYAQGYPVPSKLDMMPPLVTLSTPQPVAPGDAEREQAFFAAVEGALSGSAQPITMPAGGLGTELYPVDIPDPRRVTATEVDFDADAPAHVSLVENPLGGRAYVAVERLVRGYRISVFPLVPYRVEAPPKFTSSP